jgi:phospholipid/cholesterol/gamma-HCH transport system permease protein
MVKQIPSLIRALGEYTSLIIDILKDIGRNGISRKELFKQIVKIGADSVPIIILTAITTGMVLALQTAYGLHRFGAKNYIGNVVGLALARELGPVLSAIMLCGRVGAGITAELASMVVTEQVDAIKALGSNPITKLVTPRVVAAVIVMPLLVMIAIIVGIYGGLIVGVLDLKITAYTYARSLLYTLKIRDVIEGLIKSGVFGFLIVSIACFKGLTVRGGTEGVGMQTTSSMVTGSIVIFVANFFLTKFLLIF